MRIEIVIATDDLDIIQEHIDFFKQTFLRFEIISENFSVEDETNVEYTGGADVFTFKNAVFEIDSINNLWAMAKMVQSYKDYGTFSI
jgi:hypothetical protein